MKEIHYHKFIGKKNRYFLEINAFYIYPHIQSFTLGFKFTLSKRGIFSSLSLLLLDIDFDIIWSGDHSLGCDINVCTPFFQIFSLNFYNILHKKINK